MSELPVLALFMSVCWLATVEILELPPWVGGVGVALFFIIALWLGAWLDATEYDEGEGE